MQVQLLKAKLHRVEVTSADLEYEGSMAIDQECLDEAGILPYEKILIVNNNNGSRIETYAIPAPRGSRIFCLNGAAARSGMAGDLVTIMAFGLYEPQEARNHKPTVLLFREHNHHIARKE
ncbi:MAG: aspartate 1-decarboxylase [Oligosphaeraceae bacterium]